MLLVMKSPNLNRFTLSLITGAAIGLIGCLSTPVASAATVIWTNGPPDLNWSSPDNWNTGVSPVATDDAKFYNDGTVSSAGTVNNIVSASTAVSSLWYCASNSLYHTTQIAAGQVLSLTNGLIVGTPPYDTFTTVNVGITGSGTLSISGATTGNGNVLFVNQPASGVSGTQMATLDLSGLDTFQCTNSKVLVGVRNSSAVPWDPNFTSGTLILAKTNVINASGGSTSSEGSAGMLVGWSNGNGNLNNSGPAPVMMQLGQNNVLYAAGGISIGGRKCLSVLKFNPLFQNNNASVLIRGYTGLRLANFWIGANVDESSTAGITDGTVDFTGGAVDAQVTTMYVGQGQNVNNRNVATYGRLTFEQGTIDVNTLRIGTQYGNTQTPTIGYSSQPNGTVTVNRTGSGPAVLNVNTLMTLAEILMANVQARVSAGTLSINGGQVNANLITTTATTNGATIYRGTSTINVMGGTLIATNGIGTAGVPITTLALSNAVLQAPAFNYGASVFVSNLVLSNATATTLNVGTLPLIAAYPIELPIISYSTLLGDGSLVLGSLPAGSGYLTTNIPAKTIDVVLTNGPITAIALTWNGNVNTNWDTSTTNWLDVSLAATVFSQGAFVTFDDTATTNVVRVTGTMSPNTLTVSNVTKDYFFGGAGSLSGIAGSYGYRALDKEGTGALVISNSSANPFTGNILLGGGTVRLGGSNDRLAVNSAVTLSNVAGVLLDLNNLNQTLGPLSGGGTTGGNVALGSGTLTVTNGTGIYAGVISGTGKVIRNGTGTQTLSGTNTYSGGTTVSSGTLVVANTAGSGVGSGSLTIASTNATFIIGDGTANGSVSTAVITNNGTLSLNRSGAGTLTNLIVGTGTLSKDCSTGIAILTNANTYTGPTIINAGYLRLTTPRAVGTNTLTVYSDASARLQLASNITFTNKVTVFCKPSAANFAPAVESLSDTNTLASPLTVTEGGSDWPFQVDVGSKLTVTGTFNNIAGSATRTVHLRGTGVGDWQSAISSGASSVTALQKDDAGTWTLSGINPYTGNTTVAGGTLLVDGQLTCVTNSVAVNSGGTLGGTGVIAGPVSVNYGGTLAPGSPLRINNALTLDGNSTTFAALSITGGSASIQGLSSVDMAGTLSVTLAGMPVGGEIFQLFQASTISGGFWGYSLQTLPPGLTWNTSYLATDGTLRIDGTVIRPVISSLSFSASGLLISATNGTPNYSFDILSSTNVAAPLSSWASEQTGYFDASGNYDGSIPVDPDVPQRFYTIQMHY